MTVNRNALRRLADEAEEGGDSSASRDFPVSATYLCCSVLARKIPDEVLSARRDVEPKSESCGCERGYRVPRLPLFADQFVRLSICQAGRQPGPPGQLSSSFSVSRLHTQTQKTFFSHRSDQCVPKQMRAGFLRREYECVLEPDELK